MSSKFALAGAAVIAALLGALGYAVWVRDGQEQFAQCWGSAVAGGAGAIGGPFELVNQHGETVTESDVVSRASLIYFGYTFCPDICPLDVARNATAVDIVQESGVDAQAVFITVDPHRDTPEVLARYAANMHPDMVALTGSDRQIRDAADAFRVYYASHRNADEEDFYLVDHSSFSYLVLPEYGFVEFYSRNDSPQTVAEGIACFVGEM